MLESPKSSEILYADAPFFFYFLINTRKKGEKLKIKSCVSEQERKKEERERKRWEEP